MGYLLCLGIYMWELADVFITMKMYTFQVHVDASVVFASHLTTTRHSSREASLPT
jgi:hypothetical protein